VPDCYKSSVEKKRIHEFFEVGVLLKGLNGALEIVGGVLLYFVSPGTINKFIISLTQGELTEDPDDFIARALVHASQSFSLSTRFFGAFYLLSHGVIKVLLVAALVKQKLWAYPLSIGFLILFIVYQLYRLAHGYSLGMVLLTVFDIMVVELVRREYHYVKMPCEGKS